MPLAVRLFLASHRVVRFGTTRAEQGLELVKALHTGLWLGALSARTLVDLDEAVYRGVYAYHSTDAHNDRGLFEWERAAVDRFFPRSGRVLVTSAGGGREVLALGRLGYEVDGYECNPELVRSANDRLERAGLVGDVAGVERDRCPDPGKRYDAAVVGWGSLTYIRGTERRRAFLTDLRSTLRPGAPALVSFYARSYDAVRLRVVAGAGNAVARVLRRERLELGDVLDPVFQHYFSQEEVERELEAAGFAVDHYATADFAHAVARSA